MSADSAGHLATSGDLNRRAALASVTVALLLVGLKAYAVWRTGSLAMLGSLADTGLDLVASLVTLIAVRVAATPADAQHRFGHGKAEALAALFQVALLSVAAVGMVVRSVSRLGSDSAPVAAEAGIAVSLFAMAVTLVLIWYQARVLRVTGSVAIQADNLHYRSDLALNGAVILALALEAGLGLRGVDAFAGIAIGLWLGWGAWRTSVHAVDQLMDKEWPLAKRAAFLEVAARYAELEDIHDLRTRTSGAHDFVQFHLWVDPQMSVAQAHDLTEGVEARLCAEFPGLEILIHLDPAGQDDTGDPLAERSAQDVMADIKASSA